MLKIDTLKNNSFNHSNIRYNQKNSFGSKQVAQQAYQRINRDINMDYVAGDISLIALLANKLKNIANLLAQKDPMLELRAQVIEENLKVRANDHLKYNFIA